ncbi:MAG: cupin domain-containing protein [Acidimicrobiia bacterium]|nr:cupin domain-containing protein [Acidimicrobiia bacterium]
MAKPDVVVRLADKLAKIDEHWTPYVVGQLNDLYIKVVKVEGEFVWHEHADTDEFFLVISGALTIELEGMDDAELEAGDFFVVPQGVRHRPVAEEECELLLLEPAGTPNTGEVTYSELASPEQWL